MIDHGGVTESSAPVSDERSSAAIRDRARRRSVRDFPSSGPAGARCGGIDRGLESTRAVVAAAARCGGTGVRRPSPAAPRRSAPRDRSGCPGQQVPPPPGRRRGGGRAGARAAAVARRAGRRAALGRAARSAPAGGCPPVGAAVVGARRPGHRRRARRPRPARPAPAGVHAQGAHRARRAARTSTRTPWSTAPRRTCAIDGSKAGIGPGGRYTVRELLPGCCSTPATTPRRRWPARWAATPATVADDGRRWRASSARSTPARPPRPGWTGRAWRPRPTTWRCCSGWRCATRCSPRRSRTRSVPVPRLRRPARLRAVQLQPAARRATPARSAARPGSPTPPGTPSSARPSATGGGWWWR